MITITETATRIGCSRTTIYAALKRLDIKPHKQKRKSLLDPWGWMQPVRHALGALLLEQGHTDEAEVVFREDLGLCSQLARAIVGAPPA